MKNILTGLKECGIAENVVVFMLYLMTFSKKKPTIRQVFLTFGIIYMAFSNFRNISIFYACVLPYLSMYLPFEETNTKELPIKLYILEIIIIILVLGINISNNKYYLKKMYELCDENNISYSENATVADLVDLLTEANIEIPINYKAPLSSIELSLTIVVPTQMRVNSNLNGGDL